MPTYRMWLLAFVLIAAPAIAQDDDDEQPPGLLARYQVNQAVVERVDPDIAFQWDTAAPDERLPSGKFTAQWSGTLLLRSADKYRFHAYLQGQVRLQINGQTVLEGAADTPRWISGDEAPLSFGDQPFELTFVKTASRAQLKLYWSSGDFPLEPVPYHALFQTKPSPELTLMERGRAQFEAFRCGHCHAGPDHRGQQQERLDAPSLQHVGHGASRDWLLDKLTQSADANQSPVASSKMPHFGFSRDDAEAIIAALQANAKPVEWVAAAKLKETEKARDLQAGSTLVRSVGCLACHTWNSLGEATLFGGGSLDQLSTRRSSEWLSTWLADPAKINSKHRMPLVTLSEKERAQIVLALMTPPKEAPPATKAAERSTDEGLIARGAKLITSARCAQCHEIPGQTLVDPPITSLISKTLNWQKGCLQAPDRTRNRPGFPQVDGRGIQAYLASWQHDPASSATDSALNPNSLTGRRVLERKNCLGCHDRDSTRGLSRHAAEVAKADETLSGLHMTLIPPRLNAVGDRMQDAALAEAVRGEQKTLRLNWLRVRMPKFRHLPAEQTALLNHLVDHDRIPDGGPNSETLHAQLQEKPNPQQILAGRELLGGKGFSCVACHAVKEYTPKVTALGTRGSNLHLIGQRMRTDYFFRWTRAPLRVMPGVEMPNYQRPHEFILPGQLEQQLIAIWVALNDPNLTAPTNPAVVEQLLTVEPTDQPRVVRDVFTIPGSPDKTIARAYAIGLPGGHSILFDLDNGNVRGWTLGDFARQRCEGKRWYWDLAGTVLATQFDQRPDVILVDNETGEVISPETGWSVETRFGVEHRSAQTVLVDYDLHFSKGDVTHTLQMADVFATSAEDGMSGWTRRITAKPRSPVTPWFRNARPGALHEQAHITNDGEPATPPEGMPKDAVKFAPNPIVDSNFALTIKYDSSLQWQSPPQLPATPLLSRPDAITTVPGFTGQRLPLPRSIMPTALAWDHNKQLIFTSLKGHLYRLNSDERSLSVLEEGLAAPFGVLELPLPRQDEEDPFTIVVAHKPELLQLGLNNRGQVLNRRALATGWGITDDYHDWTCGIVRDSMGNLYLGLGSDYTFKNRPVANSRWRGDILRIDPQGTVESIARGLRYPTGLAIDDQDRLFCSDQQGVQNTFNELDYIQVGHRYGVPSRHEPEPNAPADPPAIQIPHPWTRSVNGIVWIPKVTSKEDSAGAVALSAFGGQLLGCEINNNMLIRMSLQTVGDVVQGAVYPFSKPAKEGDNANFVGPLCIGLSPDGEIYVGGLQDGGWAGGLNVGDIVKLSPSGQHPNGIREIRATRRGFEIEFFHKVDPALAVQTTQYKISGYTRVWKGDYATPDSGHHTGDITAAELSDDGRMVSLTVSGRKTGHVYDVSVGDIGAEAQRHLWPSIGHFTLHRIPD